MKRTSHESRRNDAATRLQHLFPPQQESCRLVVSCHRRDYSASLLARAVEDCDAHLLNLNVTAAEAHAQADRVMVELRVSHRDGMAVARSLERYGFNVERVMADGPIADHARERVNELIHLLEL